MKSYRRQALFLTLFSICLVGCNSGSKKGGGGGGGGSLYKQHYTNQIDCHGNKVADYNLLTTEGEELRINIHHYLIDQHKTYQPYSQIKKYFTLTDVPDGKAGYENFYTAYNYKDPNVTKEHIWCCSKSGSGTGRMWYRNATKVEWKMDDGGGPETYWGGGSDIYQLRPTTYEVNSARNNYSYTVFTDSNYDTIKENGAPYELKYKAAGQYDGTCEVDDYFKGDVARMLMYVYMHYNSMDNYDVYYTADHTPTYNIDEGVQESSTHTKYVCGTLQFSMIMDYNENDCIRKLKEWNRLDPVSDLEKKRNDNVQKTIQGNRNPFVDFPELVDKCFPDIN